MTGSWLSAVLDHPEVTLTMREVAVALVVSDASSAADVDDIRPEDADDAVEELESLGFLRAVIGTGAEVIYEVSLP